MSAPTHGPVTRVRPLPHTAFNRRMADGHKARVGHKLTAVSVSADGVLWHTIRKCCGGTVPAYVATFAAVAPLRGMHDTIPAVFS